MYVTNQSYHIFYADGKSCGGGKKSDTKLGREREEGTVACLEDEYIHIHPIFGSECRANTKFAFLVCRGGGGRWNS